MTDFTEFNLRVNMYFDRSLDREQERMMFSQVEENPACQKAFNAEQNKRNLLKTNFYRTQVTSDIIQNIKSKIKL